MKAIYTRQSIDKKDSISIESQIEFCEYELRGESYKTYIDKGYSGKNTDRPKFQELLRDIKKGLISKVYVYKLDRISRSILDFSNMMELFQEHHVEFISCTEKFDTSTPMGRAMLNICVVFAQLERETIQMRVLDAYLSRSEKSFYMGGRVPYGFQLEDYTLQGIKTKHYIAIPEEADNIKKIYELYADPTCSLGDIINHFKEHNISKRGKPWDRARISDILKNPLYVKADTAFYNFFHLRGATIVNDINDFVGTNGCYMYQIKDNPSKRSSCEGARFVLAPHEGLINSDLWLACYSKCIQNKQVAQTGRNIKNTWLGGVVKCGKCGYALTFKKYQNRQARYLLCSNKMNSKACTGPGIIYAEDFEKSVFDEMKLKLQDFKTLSKESESIYPPEKEKINTELIQVNQEIENLMEKLLSANAVLMQYINKRIAILDTQKKELERRYAELEVASLPNDKELTKISDYMDKWDSISFEDKRLVACTLIKVIHATSDTIDITWKI